MSIQIEEGKFYRTRAGAKVGPMTRDGNLAHRWLCTTTKERWADNGAINWYRVGPSGSDLVAEWTDADEAASKEIYPFTEVALTPKGGLTSRKSTPCAPETVSIPIEGDKAVYSRMDARLDLEPGTMEMMHTRLASNDAPPIAPYVYTPSEPMRVQILHEGARLTNGDRDAEYGPPAVNMAAAGALKAAFRAHMTRDISLAELEAIDMALTKLGRIATGQKVKRDTFVDCATYIAIAGEIALAEWAVFIGEKKGPEA